MGQYQSDGHELSEFDWKAIFVDHRSNAFRQAVTENTRAIFVGEFPPILGAW